MNFFRANFRRNDNNNNTNKNINNNNRHRRRSSNSSSSSSSVYAEETAIPTSITTTTDRSRSTSDQTQNNDPASIIDLVSYYENDQDYTEEEEEEEYQSAAAAAVASVITNTTTTTPIHIIETDIEAAPELDSVTSSITMPKKQVKRKNKKNHDTKASTRTIVEDDRTTTSSSGASSASSAADVTTLKATKQRKLLPTSSSSWNLSWILAMVVVSGFVAVFAAAIARSAKGVTSTTTGSSSSSSTIISDGGGDPQAVTEKDKSKDQPADHSVPSRQNPFASFDGVATITDRYRLVATYDHDVNSFTQGLLVHNDGNNNNNDNDNDDLLLVESTGMYGDSLVRKWNPTSGNVLEEYSNFDSKYFGEGITWYADQNGKERFVMLTWQERTAFIFDATKSLNEPPIDSFEFTTHTMEGWGITFDPQRKVFYVSDGSEYIMVWNLEFEEIERFAVDITLPPSPSVQQQYQQSIPTPRPLHYINELEWDDATGTIMANVIFQNAIVRILPHSGKVVQVYDLTTLYPPQSRTSKSDVMNGIAKHPTKTNHWYITGKYWPYMYLIELL